jgi:hypothetical protein
MQFVLEKVLQGNTREHLWLRQRCGNNAYDNHNRRSKERFVVLRFRWRQFKSASLPAFGDRFRQQL